MCQVRKSPINKPKYSNSLFGDNADLCMVETINVLNDDPELTTVASCCGHGDRNVPPYLTLIQPPSRLDELKEFIKNSLNWEKISVISFDVFPKGVEGIGSDFMEGKVYLGYYGF